MMKKIYKIKMVSSILLGIASMVLITAVLNAERFPGSYADQIETIHSSSSDEALKCFLNDVASGEVSRVTPEDSGLINYIEQAFGDNAWVYATYKKIEGVPPYCEEVFLSLLSDEEISLQQYERMLQDHIDNICRIHSFNQRYLSYKGPDLLVLTSEDTVKRNLIIQEISSTSPVCIETKSSIPFQYYQLYFFGQRDAQESGIGGVRLVLVQVDGEWVFDHIYCDSVEVADEDV
jgi:hypothetical protein